MVDINLRDLRDDISTYKNQESYLVIYLKPSGHRGRCCDSGSGVNLSGRLRQVYTLNSVVPFIQTGMLQANEQALAAYRHVIFA